MEIFETGMNKEKKDSNFITFNKFKYYEIPYLTLKSFFFKSIENIYFLIIGCIQLSSHPKINLIPSNWSPTGYHSTIIPLFLCYLLEVYIYVNIYCIDYKHTIEYNYKKCNTIKYDKQFVKYNKDINRGDILIIKQNEIITVDCVVLYTVNGQKAKLNYSNLNGESNNIYKQPLSSKIVFKKSKVINIDNVDCDGKISLTNNINLYFSELHFIPRNVKNIGSDIIIIVINTGNNTINNISSSFKVKKHNILEENVGIYLRHDYIIILIFTILLSSFLKLYYNTLHRMNVFKILIQNWIIFNGIVPYSIKMLLVFNKKIQCLVHNNNVYSFLNFYSVDNLPNITHLVSDKTGTMTQNKLSIRTFSLSNHFYEIKDLYHQTIEYNNIRLPTIIKYSINQNENECTTNEDEIIFKQTRDIRENKKYTIIDNETLVFDNIRKMSSVIIKDNISDKIYIITKGAIRSIYNKIINTYRIDIDIKRLNLKYSQMRTIAFAIKDITQIYDEKNNDKKIYEEENNYKYVTIMCIEDPLQHNVKKTVCFLRKKGIHTSICTGDRKETSVTIANQCGIIDNIPIIEFDDSTSVYNGLYIFLFNGKTLEKNFYNKKFIKKLHDCKSFIGYNLIPKHKRQIIQIMCKDTNKYIASIGDGNNDIPMLNESPLAISIDNKENQIVVSNSDIRIQHFETIPIIMRLSEHFKKLNVLTTIFTFFKTILYHFTIFFYFYSSYNIDKDEILFPFNFMQIQFFNIILSIFPILAINFNKSVINQLQLCYDYDYNINEIKYYPIVLGILNSMCIVYVFDFDLYMSVFMSLQLQYLLGYNIKNYNSVFIVILNVLLFIIGSCFV